MFRILVAIASVVALSACQTTRPDVIGRDDTQRESTVQDGTVLSVRSVSIAGSQTGLGALAGALVGGIAGSNVGGPRGSLLVGLTGTIVGGVVGNSVEHAATKEDGVEILVQLKNGDRRAVVQGQGAETIAVGDAVALVTTGNKVRVTKAPAVSR